MEWLSAETGLAQPPRIEVMPGGGSCELFRMRHLNRDWVIRRAPRTQVATTAHDVVREARIIRTLHTGGLPVPEVLTCCQDSTLLGAPFFIMSHIEGEVIRRRLPAVFREHPEDQARIGEELIDRLADLHAFNWRGSAIAELSRPGNFLHRQVDRWMQQLDSYRQRELPGVDQVACWLDDNLPAAGDLAVMHGDYKLDNVMFARQCPPEIVSLLDFEMTTVGDPLIDLAWAMIFWPEEGNLIAIAAPGTEAGMDANACQSPRQLVLRYAERTGRDLAAFQWYQAFSAWKLAIVLEASYVRFLNGESRNPLHEYFGFTVDQLLLRAQRFAA